ncbi:MAG: lipoyl domain-containing protein [Clostridia bacterium]|nr:lipoyl domain-containing protein [Clostridia bacterium]MDD4048198.1 lipoyl domain-containing protein [Clostridia bacterium]
MIADIVVGKLNGNVKEGKIGKMSKKVGDTVKIGDKICQVEAGKGNTPIKAKANGTITEIVVSEGAKVKVGDVVAKIEESE